MVFQATTWQEFLGGLGVLVLLYYACIGVYYRKDVMRYLARKNRQRGEDNTGENDEAPALPPTEFEELEIAVEALRQVIGDKLVSGRAVKSELIQGFSEALAGYSWMKKEAFRIAINNFIIDQAKERCGITFWNEELEQAWNRLPQ